MNENPIIFSKPMVRALIDGHKTQTRRILKQQPKEYFHVAGYYTDKGSTFTLFKHIKFRSDTFSIKCPYGNVGDRLWVRENFRGSAGYDGIKPSLWGNKPVWYNADGTPDNKMWDFLSKKTRPSIHMPRHISRISREILNIRVERAAYISEADAKAEGALWHDGHGVGHSGFRHDINDGIVWPTAAESFQHLWTNINGRESWAENPWVWILDLSQK